MDTASDSSTNKRSADTVWPTSSPKRGSSDADDSSSILVIVLAEEVDGCEWVVLNRAQAERFDPTFGKLYDAVVQSGVLKLNQFSKKHRTLANALSRLAYSSSQFLALHAGDTNAARKCYDDAMSKYLEDCKEGETWPGYVPRFYMPQFSADDHVQPGAVLEHRVGRVIRFTTFK